jgi:HD-GYP domain-containing protein (c-di-GMP phosphodiesterase class II)
MGGEHDKDPMPLTEDERINRLFNSALSDMKDFARQQFRQIRRLTAIGTALSAEKNLDRLLEMILEEGQKLTNADGGTLYLMADSEKELQFALVRTDSLGLRMGGTGGRITWPPVTLFNDDGTPNHANVSAFVALSGQTVNIPDVYYAEGFNFQGTRAFDAETGYRSKSMLVVPLRNHENDIIGVVQLLNARKAGGGEAVAFSQESQEITESLASQAAVALTNSRLIHDLENLLEAYVRTIATAIDEKSPYTGGHVRRVVEIAMELAVKINAADSGPFAGVFFNKNELQELQIAAWLHDVGKITTPEHIVDKATKLETVHDRIDLLKTRLEVIRRDHEISLLKNHLLSKGLALPEELVEEQERFSRILREDSRFLDEVNRGGETMSEERIKRLQGIANRSWEGNGRPQYAITREEIRNLSVRRGTLTDEERDIINNHAIVTSKILSQLPFPKKLSRIPEFASGHHEHLNGTGYPLGLKGDQLPLQTRILALADIFEALTAKDRPYKKGKTLSEAIKILTAMAEEGHIDPALFAFFMEKRIYLDYARRVLAPQQLDMDGV